MLGQTPPQTPQQSRSAQPVARTQLPTSRLDKFALWEELLRLVVRMTDAAERRDLGVGGGAPFPPSRKTVRPMPPEQAAERWLERFSQLAGGAGGVPSTGES